MWKYSCLCAICHLSFTWKVWWFLAFLKLYLNICHILNMRRPHVAALTAGVQDRKATPTYEVNNILLRSYSILKNDFRKVESGSHSLISILKICWWIPALNSSYRVTRRLIRVQVYLWISPVIIFGSLYATRLLMGACCLQRSPSH